jgi:hypothetical protein
MMNISRTPAPETWLSPNSIKSKAHKLFGIHTITVEKNRFSVSTINSDLFPELLSWSTIMDIRPTSACSQKLPTDVSKRGDVDTLEVNLSLSAIFDPTTLDFGFDHSCFDGLDDLLVYSPMEAFSALCWTDGIHERDSSIQVPSRSTPSPSKGAGRSQNLRPLLVSSPFADESDTDSDECLTFTEESRSHSPVTPVTPVTPIIGNDLKGSAQFSSYNNLKSLYYHDDEASSFMDFDHNFPVSNPGEAIGFFPVPASPRRTVPNRIAAFCAHLPASLTFRRSPTSS